MAEYIEREKLIELIKNGNGRIPDWVREYISECPTADVVPVVRCKNCKYFQRTICDKFSEAFFNCRRENDYCSYGVRKDGEQK